jgi:hypothetical protein
MGKWKGSRGGRKKKDQAPAADGAVAAEGGAKKEAVWFNLGPPKASWTVEKKNDLFEDYYRKVLGFDRASDGKEAELEADWQQLLETMRTDLPTTIRVTSSSPFEPLMTAKIVEFFRPGMAEAASTIEDEAFAFDRIPWCAPPPQIAATFQKIAICAATRSNFNYLLIFLKCFFFKNVGTLVAWRGS